jgi:predicted AAA+ superfamily ATPase
LKTSRKQVSPETVQSYLDALTEAFVFYRANRFQIKGKSLLKTLPKYYACDTGLRQILLGRERGSDIEHLLENIVYIELLRRGNRVWVGKNNAQEVDFVTRDTEGFTKYYQVALSARDERVMKRELSALDTIKDHNEKTLLTLDPEEPTHNGVKQRYAISWLMEGESSQIPSNV